MAFNGKTLLKSVAAAVALSTAMPMVGAFAPTAALAASTLPAPYVSRALDAVLMPVDGSVISAFGLPAGATGVLVLATQPDGLADSAGIEPGDVIDFVGKAPVKSPIELDEIVYYWILQGIYDFEFGGLRSGSAIVTPATITLEYWEEVIEITTVSTWVSYSYESFSYEEYYTEYSEEISVSYEESITMIEETVTSEEYSEEIEEYSEESTEEVTDEVAEEDVDATEEEGIAEGEDEAADEATDDEGGDEEIIEEDDGGDDMADDGADDGGDEGGDEGGEEIEE